MYLSDDIIIIVSVGKFTTFTFTPWETEELLSFLYNIFLSFFYFQRFEIVLQKYIIKEKGCLMMSGRGSWAELKVSGSTSLVRMDDDGRERATLL